MNNYREEMKKKICNFFNFVYAGWKIITGDALILADLKNAICFVRYCIFVKTEWVLLPWVDDFIIIAQTDVFANIRGQYWTNFKYLNRCVLDRIRQSRTSITVYCVCIVYVCMTDCSFYTNWRNTSAFRHPNQTWIHVHLMLF